MSMSDEELMKLIRAADPRAVRIPPGVRAIADAIQAAERERLKARVEEAFRDGFYAPRTYNDTVLNTADEAWEEAKAGLLKD